MKNKGLLFLLVGLGVLTLIVLVALIFFYPKESAKTGTPAAQLAPSTHGVSGAETAPTAPGEFDPVEWTRNPQTVGVSPEATGTNPAGPSKGGDFLVTMAPPSAPVSGTLPQPTAAPPKSGIPSSPGAAFPGEAKPTSAAETKSAKPEAKPAAKPVKSEAKPAKPEAKPAGKTVKVKEFWIQVGAYKDRYQAETAAKSLESQGLKGSLFTVQSNGQTVVRVRVGPYPNQDEAKKFLAWVKPVKGFEESFITEASATRVQ